MNASLKTAKWKFFGPTLILLMGIIALAFPRSQDVLRDFLFREKRTILAKTKALITPEGPELTIIKVRQNGHLLIEVYVETDNVEQLSTRWALPLKMKEGYFMFHESATNLALADIDRDNSLEILVPAIEQNTQARLLIYKYNPATGNFTPLTPSY